MDEGNKKPTNVANEATSKETLEDIEDNEKSSAAKQDGNESDVPSPDGAFDESDESKDAGPI